MKPLLEGITLAPAFQGIPSNSGSLANDYQNKILCDVPAPRFRQPILQQGWKLALSLKSQLKHLYHLIHLALPFTISAAIRYLPENQPRTEAGIRKVDGTNLRWIKTGRQHRHTYPAAGCLKNSRYHLAGQSVLCIGGRAALYPDYRQLIEAAGGQFMIFRGSMQANSEYLLALLARADNVICPVDCISHEDFFTARHYCQCTSRNCILLERSDLTTFSKAIEALPGKTTCLKNPVFFNRSAA